MANIYNITAELEDIFLELEETGGYFTLDDLDCIKVKFEIENLLVI